MELIPVILLYTRNLRVLGSDGDFSVLFSESGRDVGNLVVPLFLPQRPRAVVVLSPG